MTKIITSEILVANCQCPYKAYLLLCTEKKGVEHEYMRILDQKRQNIQRKHIEILRKNEVDVHCFSLDNLKGKHNFLVNANLVTENLSAGCAILSKVKTHSTLGRYCYVPTIFVSATSMKKTHKLELFFVNHVLTKVQNKHPIFGYIVGLDGKSHRVRLENSLQNLIPFLEPLEELIVDTAVEAPSMILNKNCKICQFHNLCRNNAEKEDHLSLLDGISTQKAINKYEKRGIFTIKQLSYLFRPRKRKKRYKSPPPIIHKPELQALAIREKKIYLQELPELSRQPVELFLDIEGVPDNQFIYLIGLLISENDSIAHNHFWADTTKSEIQMWEQFLAKINLYPDAPIYHYGSYDSRSLTKLARRYDTDAESLAKRLVNITKHIYGKVYFPVYSNSLKDLGTFIGATWTSPNASGLQSLVWRDRWDETRNTKFKNLLLTYNWEDCLALKQLIDELSKIKHSANMLAEVDFADHPKQYATDDGQGIHTQFKAILRFAHFGYDQKKISFRQNEVQDSKTNVEKERKTKRKPRPKATKLIQVSHRKICPKCQIQLNVTELLVRSVLTIDLVSTRTGMRKTVIGYVGNKAYCSRCGHTYVPSQFSHLRGSKLYGHQFRAWCVYLRVALRMPYTSIVEIVEEQFRVKMSEAIIPVFIRDIASHYAETEQIIIQRLLKSPFIHADETTVNIRGADQYVWVFTDGKRVLLNLRETREAAIVHDILAAYSGILISDFYPGYDAATCRQQKCWVHLIRDINNDLWKAPYDTEFEAFVLKVRNLIIPIMEAVQKYGLKRRNLNKFKKEVDRFYKNVVTDKHYKSELTQKYQNRFKRYRESLFTFLDYDGIPWHNNAAERALRHLIVQEKISGYFYASLMPDYLRLLGIRQTCRFQGKSFFKFLFSGETDIDKFQVHNHKR